MPIYTSPFNQWNSISYTDTPTASDAPETAFDIALEDFRRARQARLDNDIQELTCSPPLASPPTLSYAPVLQEPSRTTKHGFSKWIQKIESS